MIFSVYIFNSSRATTIALIIHHWQLLKEYKYYQKSSSTSDPDTTGENSLIPCFGGDKVVSECNESNQSFEVFASVLACTVLRPCCFKSFAINPDSNMWYSLG